jgi:GT2 family glycosyltransferase
LAKPLQALWAAVTIGVFRNLSLPNAHIFPAPPKITIIVAAYNRGPVLSRVLRTAIAQTETRWQAIVVGDACTDDTGEHIAALADDRIRFANLPERFGEQAGPNSVGMALATSPYVAFLNQDDYWLPDHLASAVAALDASGADLFWSRATFFSNRGAWDDRAFFVEVSPRDRQLQDAYTHPHFFAEPMSAWVVRKEALDRLGPMRLASQTAQFPITDYCQRACHLGLRLHTGEDITVLKDRFWAAPPSYHHKGDYAEAWVRHIESGTVSELLDGIEQDLWLSRALGMDRAFTPPAAPGGRAHPALIELETGLNLAELQSAARSRLPNLLTQTLQNRTGTTLQVQPQLDQMIAFARGLIG